MGAGLSQDSGTSGGIIAMAPKQKETIYKITFRQSPTEVKQNRITPPGSRGHAPQNKSATAGQNGIHGHPLANGAKTQHVNRSDGLELANGDDLGNRIRPATLAQDSGKVAQPGTKVQEDKNNEAAAAAVPVTQEAVGTRADKPKEKYVRIQNMLDGKQYTDTLHQKSFVKASCDNQKCHGSIVVPKKAGIRSKEELLRHAEDFIRQYYTNNKREDTPSHRDRWAEVEASVEERGTYDLTESELIFGAKTAWRNAPRCIGRIQWTKLQVFDARKVNTTHDMFQAICRHMSYATNNGNLRSTITVFPHKVSGGPGFRVWNSQLIRYACYKQPDGTFIGDPANLEITEVCQKLGWRGGSGGAWDVLPLVLQANGGHPELFEVPRDLILEVEITHPDYDWFADLGLRWYALPAICNMMLDVGGLEFPGIPFNGWYMVTEIGARDFCDENRLNMCEPIANKMGLDTSTDTSLWKDKALVETNIAVMHSFQKANVTMTDHHTASKSFMKHMENEQRLRGGCPADWVWVVPPLSGNITPVFHQEMLCYNLKPSYEYQEDPWRTYSFDTTEHDGVRRRRKSLKEVAIAIKFTAKLMEMALAKRIRATILYATETGRSETYAKMLGEIFKHAFNVRVHSMEDYDPEELRDETIVLVVTSTFGNGDPPENGQKFRKYLVELSKDHLKTNNYSVSSPADKSSSDDREWVRGAGATTNHHISCQPLGNIRYSVFGLGSSAYPNFAAFGKTIDSLIANMGGEKILAMGEGDELRGQEDSFKKWAKIVFQSACGTFNVGGDVNMNEANESLQNDRLGWTPEKFRLVPKETEDASELCEALTKLHKKTVMPCLLLSSRNLHSEDSTRSTIQVRLDTQGTDELQFVPGYHIAICPTNEEELVNAVISRINSEMKPDQVVVVQVNQHQTTQSGSWQTSKRLPPCSMRHALEHYLDITTPPSPSFLRLLSLQATNEEERARLTLLGEGRDAYDEWKLENSPTLVEVFKEFPSVQLSIEFLIQEVPLLKPRYYSISSSPDMHPGEIHLTVAVVQWRTEGDSGSLRNGVCSTWLNRLEGGAVVPAFIRPAPLFRLPEKKELPCILVGPGTGIAPFRSFWQQRLIDLKVTSAINTGEKVLGDIHMFFGCRHPKLDDIYAEEKAKAIQEGALKEVHVAYSREENEPKRYVQHALQDEAKTVHDIICTKMGHFFVCGDVSMAGDVQKTLEAIICEQGGFPSEKANEYVRKMREQGRYHEDIFGVTLRTAEIRKQNRVRLISNTEGSLPQSKDLSDNNMTSNLIKSFTRNGEKRGNQFKVPA